MEIKELKHCAEIISKINKMLAPENPLEEAQKQINDFALETIDKIERGKMIEIKTGVWMPRFGEYGVFERYEHTECGYSTLLASKYCPLCGAKMRV
jgi:rubrerythrin